MSEDDEFTPRLGGKRNKDGKLVTRYGRRILPEDRLADGKSGIQSRRFDGSPMGDTTSDLGRKAALVLHLPRRR